MFTMFTRPVASLFVASLITVLVAGCAGSGSSVAPSLPTSAPPVAASGAAATSAPPIAPTDAPEVTGTITLYSTVTAATVEAVVAGYQAAHPGVKVDLFRAPTGEVTARIAAEQRSGGVKADLFWLSDPLSVQQYDADGLLAAYTPADAATLAPGDQAPTYTGTRLLSMVIVAGADLAPAPADWSDLTDPSLVDAVAIPDPGFAGSAFGLLGHFAQDPAYGFGFYERLKDNGAVVVKSPDEVTTGVAEGRFKAGITLDFSARSAIAKGSPVQLVWPTSGSVTMASPIAALAASDNAAAARSFIDFVLSDEGQSRIAETGWQPARPEIAGGPPIEGLQVRPDFAAAFGRQDELLADFRAIFGE